MMRVDATTVSGVDMSLAMRGTTNSAISAQQTSISRITGVDITTGTLTLTTTSIEGEDVIGTETTSEDMCNMRGVREIKMMKARPVLHILLFSLCLIQVSTRGNLRLALRIRSTDGSFHIVIIQKLII